MQPVIAGVAARSALRWGPFRAELVEDLTQEAFLKLGWFRSFAVRARRERSRYRFAAGASGGVERRLRLGLCFLVLVKGTGPFGPSPERLLARAYEANRIWPMRFPDASYTPLKSVERSATVGGTPLAEADVVVSRGFDQHPKDPRWLQLRSEADFLRRRYDSAIAYLQPLSEGSYISSGILIQLGTAYLARSMADGEKEDGERAVEYFSRTLDAEPRNPIVLFNRALALETLFMWDRAEQDWKAYLEVDPASGWAAEARYRLNQVTLKKKSGSAN